MSERKTKQFSRRYVTAEAHIEAKSAKEARVEQWHLTMARCEAERAKRTDAEQLDVLDARLGKGKGAKKERIRLFAAIKERALEANKAKATKKREKKDKKKEKGK